MNALKILATICEKYAKKCDALFNGKKSLLIIYKYTKSQPPDLGIVINNVRVPRVDEVIVLGYYMCEDIYKFNASKCVSDFNRKSNMFFANFKHANSYIRNVLFHKYCTAFYGNQVLPMFGDYMHELYLHCMENSRMQGVESTLDDTWCTFPTFGWLYGY